MASALCARSGSPTTATSYRITSAHAAWEERGGTIIPTTFKLCTGGATARRDRAVIEEIDRRFLPPSRFYSEIAPLDVRAPIGRFTLTPIAIQALPGV